MLSPRRLLNALGLGRQPHGAGAGASGLFMALNVVFLMVNFAILAVVLLTARGPSSLEAVPAGSNLHQSNGGGNSPSIHSSPLPSSQPPSAQLSRCLAQVRRLQEERRAEEADGGKKRHQPQAAAAAEAAVGDTLPASGGGKKVASAAVAVASPVTQSEESAATGSSTRRQPYLIIGMPSAPRPREIAANVPLKETALYRTIASIAAEMGNSDALRRLVRVVVMNARPLSPAEAAAKAPPHHATFEAVRRAFGASAHSARAPSVIGSDWLHFVDKPMRGHDSFRHSSPSSGGLLGEKGGKTENKGDEWLPRRFDLSAESLYSDADASSLFRSAASPALSPAEVDADAAEFGHKGQEAPSPRAIRHTQDVVALLDVVKGMSAYYYFSEDDMQFCGNTVGNILYLIEKARRTMAAGRPLVVVGDKDGAVEGGDGGGTHGYGEGPFAAIRCSFGLNGIIMHNGGSIAEDAERGVRKDGSAASSASHPPPEHYPSDVAAFADYLFRHQRRRPPDHLATEFFAQESAAARAHYAADTYVTRLYGGPQNQQLAKEGTSSSPLRRRRVGAFRYNVVNHLGGAASTLRDEDAWAMPECGTELTEPQVFAVEAWDPSACGHSDFWPCSPPGERRRGGGDEGRSERGFGRLQMRAVGE